MRYADFIILDNPTRPYRFDICLYAPLINFMGVDNFVKLSMEQRRDFVKITKQGAFK